MDVVRIEILTLEGCPNVQATHELVRRAVQLEAVDAAIDVIEVKTFEAAQRLRFLGSPSVRVDGEDVERPTSELVYGLMCRTYRDAVGVSGVPPIEVVRAAIRRRGDGSPTRP